MLYIILYIAIIHNLKFTIVIKLHSNKDYKYPSDTEPEGGPWDLELVSNICKKW